MKGGSAMQKAPTDEEIVGLFLSRDERAIADTERKHGKTLFALCRRILNNKEDAEECCESVYLDAWQSIPPARPQNLAAYLCKIARCRAINLLRERTREKRGGGVEALPFEELADLAAKEPTASEHLEQKELSQIINRFLGTLDARDRCIFLLRYYNENTLEEIAKVSGLTRQGVRFVLKNLKERLRVILEQEGYLK